MADEHPGPPHDWTGAKLAAYTGDRAELTDMAPDLDGRVLDLGCSTGAVGAHLKARAGAEVWGIELDRALAAEASGRLERVITASAIDGLQQLGAEGISFRGVIMADVLEHLSDPWQAFDLATSLVEDGGWVLVSVPNITHWDTLWHQLRGEWPYRDRGIHDATHLRFFARRNVVELMNRGRCELAELRRIYRLVERPTKVNRWARFVGWLWPNLFTFQFYALGRVRDRAI